MKTMKLWKESQLWRYIKLSIALGAISFLYSCGDDDGAGGDDGPTDPVITGEANVRITEVNAAANLVTLENFGDAEQDLTDFWFCHRRNYGQFSLDNTDAADLTLDAGETITFTLSVNDESSDVAIYNTNSFTDANAMVDFMQYNGSFTDNGRENVAVEKGIWTAGEFVEGASTYTYDGTGTTNGADQWSGDPVIPGVSNVRILSVDPGQDLIKLKNFGTESQDLSGYFFCLRKAYPAISSLTPTTGDLVLDPEEEVEFSVTIEDASSDVGLYSNNSGFASADNMVDFMQFGDAVGTAGREDVAVTKGIWSEGDFVNGVGPYTYDDTSGDSNGADFWSESEEGSVNVRIYKVDAEGDKVTLKNFGTRTSDLSPWFWCHRKSYGGLEGTTPTEGNLYLAPGEEAEFDVTIDDVSSDVGLYRNNSGFANADNMVDFMQYGDAVGTAGREDVAVTAGIWTANAYVNGVGPFTYDDETGSGNGAEEWVATEEGEANVRLVLIDAENDKITLKNFGNRTANLAPWFFCYRKTYAGIDGMTPTSGNLYLAPGEEAEFDVTIDDTSSDVGLYKDTGFASANSILDWMQYGEDVDSNGRENVAVEAGIWTENEFVPNPGPFAYDGDGTENGASSWNQ